MLLAEFSIWPMDKGISVSSYVARCLKLIDESGLPYRLGPLGTCVEGEPVQIFALIDLCHKALEADCDRIACTVKMDWRRGQTGRLTSKIESVERKLGKKLKT